MYEYNGDACNGTSAYLVPPPRMSRLRVLDLVDNVYCSIFLSPFKNFEKPPWQVDVAISQRSSNLSSRERQFPKAAVRSSFRAPFQSTPHLHASSSYSRGRFIGDKQPNPFLSKSPGMPGRDQKRNSQRGREITFLLRPSRQTSDDALETKEICYGMVMAVGKIHRKES
jgi:hypothetical protein